MKGTELHTGAEQLHYALTTALPSWHKACPIKYSRDLDVVADLFLACEQWRLNICPGTESTDFRHTVFLQLNGGGGGGGSHKTVWDPTDRESNIIWFITGETAGAGNEHNWFYEQETNDLLWIVVWSGINLCPDLTLLHLGSRSSDRHTVTWCNIRHCKSISKQHMVVNVCWCSVKQVMKRYDRHHVRCFIALRLSIIAPGLRTQLCPSVLTGPIR